MLPSLISATWLNCIFVYELICKSLAFHCRVLKKVPEAIETFADKAAGLLSDRHHGVLLSGTTLMLEICEIEPNIIEQYRRHVPMLCKILRSLLMSGFAPEHDVGGITDPFLQVKVSHNHAPWQCATEHWQWSPHTSASPWCKLLHKSELFPSMRPVSLCIGRRFCSRLCSMIVMLRCHSQGFTTLQ